VKALSLWQPWASLIAVGAKRFETRSWQTSHRGPLLIHAAQKWGGQLWAMCRTEPSHAALNAASYVEGLGERRGLPFGAAVAAGRPMPGPDQLIHHKNEDKTDNRLSNLELLTRSEHGHHHIKNRTRDAAGRVCKETPEVKLA
jgi:hypothetical protein